MKETVKPQLSIVVCTYNRDQYIQKTLEHLRDQTIKKSKYEVIIVNNNSTDNTNEIIESFLKGEGENCSNFRYFIELNQGHSFSRNRGITESNSPLINFIDDDAFVKPDFAEEIIKFFDETPDAKAIGGKIIPHYEGEKPKWMSKYLLPLVAALDMGTKVTRFKGSKFPIGANMTFRSSVFEKYGIFNVDLGRKGSGLEGGDEKDVFMRMKKNNEPIYYLPTAQVDHVIPEKRIQKDYIKGLAVGVGTSEKKRLKTLDTQTKLGKILSEFIKIGATGILFMIFMLSLKFEKASMIFRFRIWVLQGYLSK
ncbi:MAG: glycosyltransferase [bacterium]|nr:glycosyltransferase [bacterium]